MASLIAPSTLWIDAITALISFIDTDYRYRVCNQAYTSWFGKRREDVLGKTMAEVLGDKAWQAVRARADAALAGQIQDFESEVEYGAVGTRWIHAVYTPQRDESGRVTGFMALVTDVTAYKRAERELAASEESFRAFLTASSASVYRMSPDWSELRQLVGRDFIADTTDPTRTWLEKYIHPDDQARVMAAIRETVRTKGTFELEHRVIRVDGTFGWAVSRAIPRVGPNGEIIEWFGAAFDVTKRHQAEAAQLLSEERYRSLFNSIDAGFCVIEMIYDASGRATDYLFLEVNPSFEKQTGLMGAVGKRMREFVPDHEEHWFSTYGQVARTGEPIRFVGDSHALDRWFELYAFRVDRPEQHRVAVLFSDITPRKRAEDALREAKEQAEQASRAKDTFLAQLSHELRTPLTPVLMAASQLADNEQLPAGVREQLRMMERNVALEARLIDDLLDLTRISRGRLSLRSEPCDVHLLLDLVLEILGGDAREKGIAIERELHASRHHLSGDSARLQQVFWNLLRNAVKFTPEGGLISVRTYDAAASAGDEGSGRLGIEVSDSGIGFPPQQAEKLFRAFEQQNAGRDQRFPGLGLGLTIARAIVDLHGGSIRAESAGVGQGAVFAVELPGAHVPPTAQPTGTAGAVAPITEPEPAMHLLVVEDHPPTLKVLSRLLQAGGHRVTPATSVASALSAAAEARFDAVLSDLGLPDGTGFELMEKLRTKHDLRGIALSGYGMEDDVRRAIAAGFVAHLTKPVDVKEVRRALRQFVATRR